MKRWIVALVALLVCSNAFGAAPAIESYGQLPTLSEVTLSPDGANVAYVRVTNAKRFIVIQKIGIKQPIAVIGAGEDKLRSLQWADNTHLLITTSMTRLPAGLIGRRGEFSLAQVYDLQDKSFRPLLEGDVGKDVLKFNALDGDPMPRTVGGHTIVFVPGVYYDSDFRRALFAEDLSTRETHLVTTQSDIDAESWVVDDAGNIVAEETYNVDDKLWKLRLYGPNGLYDALKVPSSIEQPYVEGLSEDSTSVVVSLPATQDWRSYRSISLKDGAQTPWARDELHFGGVLQMHRSQRVIGGEHPTDKTDYVFFDPHADLVWRSIKAAFKTATNVSLVSESDDWSKVVARAFGSDYGDTYYFVDMKTHQASAIGPAYDGIEDVAQENWIQYNAADGRPIHAYLTLPIGRDAKNLPLIVLPHGGPHLRDEPGFDWLSQALASRGYAVLQPEFRGSSGFGWDLFSAGFGEFGRKMQTDLSDGVRALAAQGLIDPKRVCIVGGSYGGYAALAGATIDTGVYRCAVSIAGISDLRRQLGDADWPEVALDSPSDRFWDRYLGITSLSDPKLDAVSPIEHLDKITIPVLLIHGRDDTVVRFDQSERMASAMKSAGKPVEFVVLDHEDHWLSQSETRLQALQATVKFLEANNPPN